MADVRPAALHTGFLAAALLAALTSAPARTEERRAGPPVSLVPATPVVAVPAPAPSLASPATQAPAAAPAHSLPVPAAQQPAAILRSAISPLLYLPPGPGRPGLTARVPETRR